MSGIDYEALRRAAEAATPGPWTAEVVDGDVWAPGNRERICKTSSFNYGHDAAYIATASADVVLALLGEVEALRAKVARVEVLARTGEDDALGRHMCWPWPEGVAPTPEQFADWYVTVPRDERIRVAAQTLDASERSSRCFVMNHEGLQEELIWTRRSVLRYRNAWLSARRRVHPQNFLRAYLALDGSNDDRGAEG